VIVVNGIKIMRDSVHDTLDGSVDPGLHDRVRESASEMDGARCIEKCRIRKSGVGYFVELHVQVNPHLSVFDGHKIGHDVKAHLLENFPQLLDVVVHLEPLPPDIPS
jgi:divalent metal cation (Fe/Co/Zn/Cd) transporter